MNCNCLEECNKRLEAEGVCIATALQLRQPYEIGFEVVIVIGLENLPNNKRRKRPTLVATFCPFCGVRAVPEEGQR